MKINKRYLIRTDSGYQDFDAIQKTEEKGLSITTNKNVINCTKTHRMMIDGKFKCAMDLKIGDLIGDQCILNITPSNLNEYFDPINVQGDNSYFSLGINHHNCSIVIVDECAFVKQNLWENFSDSIFPAQSGFAWKKNILISTTNGLNHFYDIVQGAKEGINGYEIFEVDWKDVPRFKPNGSIIPPEEFQKNIIAKRGILHFNQNYANEFLGSSHTLITSEKLQSMRKGEICEIRDGKLNIYEYPIENHKYIMTVDPSKDGIDAFAVQITDITDYKFKQVASAQLHIDYLLMPEFLNEWGEFYNKAYLIIENNEGAGQSIADQMYQNFEYENLHFDKIFLGNISRSRKKKYPGFRTTVKTRKQIIQTLKLFIENDKLDINDNATINEFYQFILIKNKFQADQGAHDDMIMSLALTFVPFCNTKNFEDMRKLIKNLYNDDIPDSEKVNFSELLTIGSFQDGTDENDFDISNQESWNRHIIEDGGFI